MADVTSLRVSGTCTIWMSSAELRIRARIAPPWIFSLLAVAFSAGILVTIPERMYFYAVITSVGAALCICAALAVHNLSAIPEGFHQWSSLGPIRYSVREIPIDGLVEVIACSVYVAAYSMTYHHLELRRDGDLGKAVLDFWSGSDAVEAARALAQWLNEHRRPGSEAIALNTDRAIDKAGKSPKAPVP